jgi:hypothetical protein
MISVYSKFSVMFQHDQARADMTTATRELLEEYNISFIAWLLDLSPTKLFFDEIQRQAKEHYSNIKTQD